MRFGLSQTNNFSNIVKKSKYAFVKSILCSNNDNVVSKAYRGYYKIVIKNLFVNINSKLSLNQKFLM